MATLLTEKAQDVFDVRLQPSMLLNEAVSLVDRFVFHQHLGIETRLEREWRPNKSIIERLRRIWVGALQQVCRPSDINHATCVLLVSPGFDLYGPLAMASLIKEIDPAVPTVLISDYTYEQSVSTLLTILSGRDVYGHDIQPWLALDPGLDSARRAFVKFVDIVIDGEGFDVLRRWFRSPRTPRPLQRGTHRITSVRYRQSDGGRLVAQETENDALGWPLEGMSTASLTIVPSSRSDISDYPIPDYSDMVSIYRRGQLEFGRGCKYACAFCERTVGWGLRYQSKDPVQALSEIEELISKYPKWKWIFWDAALDTDVLRSSEFLGLLESEGPVFDWMAVMRFNPLPPTYFEMMKSAGCTKIEFGMESYDSDVLRSMRKAVRLDVMDRLLEAFAQSGIERASMNHMLGWPTDTTTSQSKTMRFVDKWAEKLPDLVVTSSTYIPGPNQPLGISEHARLGIELLPLAPDRIGECTILESSLGRLCGLHFRRGMSRTELLRTVEFYAKQPYYVGPKVLMA